MLLPSKSIERNLIKRGVKWIAAVDEVGRGSWAGPVVAAAVLFEARFFLCPPTTLCLLRDSKLITRKSREEFYGVLEVMRSSSNVIASERSERGNLVVPRILNEIASGFRPRNDGGRRVFWAVASVTPALIDRLNIHRATFVAMARAIKKLPQKPDIVLVDGIWSIPGCSITQEVYPHGDRRIFSIAVASIIAKVTRDRLMMRLGKKYPDYGFERHKGYGTKLHQAQLASFGVSAVHRRSFKPLVLFV